MKAGAELDALVAEKVMDWHKGKTGEIYNDMMWYDSDSKNTGWFQTEYGSRECDPFSPSDDIRSAFEVVEKMQKQNILITIAILPEDGLFTGSYLAYSKDTKLIAHAVDNFYGTAPYVICMAALKAVGEF